MNRRSLLQLPAFQPKQQFAFNAVANEKLCGGATRGGKTSFNKLMLIRLCSAVTNLRSDIFRVNLDDVYESYMTGEFSFPELLAPWERDGLVKITDEGVEFLWNGSGITLKHLGSDRATSKGQGTPVQIRIFDEATQLLESRFRFLRGWVGMTEGHRATAAVELEKVFPELTYQERYDYFPQIIYATNPIGLSAGYFRRGFVNAAPRYEIFRAPQEDGGFLRVYVPFKVGDNKFENEAQVRSRIAGLGDDAMVDALLNENWDAPVGDFIREYNSKVHVVPDFEPPDYWVKYRVFDWGHSEPFAVIWICISDGEPFKDHMGRERWFRAGCKIVYREWYGAEIDESTGFYLSTGLGMRNKDIAEGILHRTSETTTGITMTDNLPFQSRGADVMATEFMLCGLPLTLGNTARVIGWKALKDQLKGIDGDPMFLVTESCKACREYLPALQRHKTKPDDAVEDGEATHICFAAGTLVQTPKGLMPIEKLESHGQVVAGDSIARNYHSAGIKMKNTDVVKLQFSDGYDITCTPDHEILTVDGWTRACDMAGLSCIVSPWNHHKSFPKPTRYLTDKTTTDSKARSISALTGTSRISADCTELFGSSITDQSLKASISTTRTRTPAITTSPTLKLLKVQSTSRATCRHLNAKRSLACLSRKLSPLLLNGTQAKRAGSGIASITRTLQTSCTSGLKRLVTIADWLFRPPHPSGFALVGASSGSLPSQKPITFPLLASFAGLISKGLNTLSQSSARPDAELNTNGRTVICESVSPAGKADVYCLTEPHTNSFRLANGLVVSNCDCCRLGALTYEVNLPKAPVVPRSQYVQPPLSQRVTITPEIILKNKKSQKAKTRGFR